MQAVHHRNMALRLKNTDRNTPLLLPPDLRDWVAEDDLAHFVIQAVERLPLTAFALNPKGCGDEQYSPHTLLALLIYCYANGVLSSRRIERATCRGVAARQAREGSAKGPEHKPPSATPAPEEQINLTDPDARLMRKNKREGYRQSYNAQAVWRTPRVG